MSSRDRKLHVLTTLALIKIHAFNYITLTRARDPQIQKTCSFLSLSGHLLFFDGFDPQMLSDPSQPELHDV